MRYKSYLLGVLAFVLASNCMDRVALGLLLQELKVDLALSDTQLGLLTGIAFALFYSVMGIPIARWADRGNRVTLITITTALWSAAVALCGMASSFLQLLLIRIGVAVGEAGCNPPAHSLIADYFSRLERPKAVAIYMLGAPLATVLGYFGAGWLNELCGWRVTFIVLGLPGVALAALVMLTLKEPRRQQGVSTVAPNLHEHPSLTETCIALWQKRSFRHLLIFYSVSAFFSVGTGQWKPSFFIRSYGLQTGELGTWLAVIYGLGGILGTWLGGVAASRYAAGNERLQLNAICVAYCVLAGVSVCTYLSPDAHLAFALLAVTMIATGTVVGPLFATIHAVVPQRMRAMSIAILFLFANLIGMGLGPLAVGVLSDAFHSWAGEDSLRFALLALSPGYLWCALHLRWAGMTVTVDLENPGRPPGSSPSGEATATSTSPMIAASEPQRIR
jgi:MFS family permease